MRKFGVVSLMFVGFVAGIIFVYSCGGGGSAVIAEITSVLGIETRLDNITNAILGVDATTDTTGVESTISSLQTSIDSIDTKLADIDATLQDIDLNLSTSVNSTLTLDYITDGVVPAVSTWYGQSTPIDITGYRQARIFVVPQHSQIFFGASFSAGGVSTVLKTIANTEEIGTIDILGDTMLVDIYTTGGVAPIGDPLRVTVQLVK